MRLLINPYKEAKKLIKEVYKASKILFDETIVYLKPGKQTVDLEDITNRKDYFIKTVRAYSNLEGAKSQCKTFKLDFDEIKRIAFEIRDIDFEYEGAGEKTPINKLIDTFEYIKKLKKDSFKN